MASEIRVNQIQNRSGLGTVTFSDTGVSIAGVTTVSDLRTTNNAGIGTNNPRYKLEVTSGGTTGTGQTIAQFNDANNNDRISIVDETTSGSKPTGFKSPTGFGMGFYSSNNFIFYGASDTERMRVNQNGVTVSTGSSITVGETFIQRNAIGLGTTTTTGRNAGVGTAAGTIIFNATTNKIEMYNGTDWQTMLSGFVASGGTLTFSGGKTIHTFTSSGTFTVSSGSNNVEYLVIGGGGGGGTDRGGGGGAGALRYATGFPLSPGNYTVTVGAGGGLGGDPQGSTGQNGSSSVFSSITSPGGGGGGGETTTASSGGSGGGAAYNPTTAGSATASGAGTNNSTSPASGWGSPGGTGTSSTPGRIAAGGGGAGGAGGNGSTPTSGAGGNGLSYSISGSATVYAGGGGGGATNGDPGGSAGPGPGGPGGGGAGGNGPGSTPGTAGTSNTGGGGGGGGYAGTGTGGNGGSGIVIIAYPS